MAKGKKTGTAPGKKANPIRSGFDGPCQAKSVQVRKQPSVIQEDMLVGLLLTI